MKKPSSSEFLTHEELFEATENDTSNNNFKTSAEFLLSAISDWPTLNLQEPNELISELKNEIKDKLTYVALEKYLKVLRPEYDSWKMESISSLLEMFDFNRNNIIDKKVELESIISKITKHYRNKK